MLFGSDPVRANHDPGIEFAPDLYGAFPVKRLFWVVLTVFCSERERPFFVPSPAIRSPERAERSLAACRLASLVFRSALTPEHAEGRWTGRRAFLRSSSV